LLFGLTQLAVELGGQYLDVAGQVGGDLAELARGPERLGLGLQGGDLPGGFGDQFSGVGKLDRILSGDRLGDGLADPGQRG